MKKIVNIFILIVVCLLPVMVEAKADISFDNAFDKKTFLTYEDDKYYFIGFDVSDPSVEGSLKVYDSSNNLISEDVLFGDFQPELLFDYPYLVEYYRYMFHLNDYGVMIEDKENNIFNIVYYYDEVIDIFDLENNTDLQLEFDENLDRTKSILGKSYDVYKILSDRDLYVNYIKEYEGYYVVNYSDSNDSFTSVFDYECNEILSFEVHYPLDVNIYIYDKIIYVMEHSKKLDLYKLDGTEIQSFDISYDVIDDFMESNQCTYIDSFVLKIVNNDLFINYLPSDGCPRRLSINDAADLVKEIDSSQYFSLKFKLNFDIETVSSNNGEFTYETKVDEDGKSYVELKVVPKDGYSVEEIIVTDVNGDRIEVTNNKFYKPMNDVKIEVKYVQGEYLPIPDTFLGKSVSLILIGLILISLGFYTINFVRQE